MASRARPALKLLEQRLGTRASLLTCGVASWSSIRRRSARSTWLISGLYWSAADCRHAMDPRSSAGRDGDGMGATRLVCAPELKLTGST